MTSFEKRFTAVVMALGCTAAVIGYFDETPFGILMLLVCSLYSMYVYFTSTGEDE
jgi:hypothetical protein